MEQRSEPLAMVLQATQYAADKHRNQRRKDVDASPYINHPIALANVLSSPPEVSDTPSPVCRT